MDDVRGRLLAELLRLRMRAEEIGRQLKDLDRQDRLAQLRVIPGGAAGPSSSPGVAVANTHRLLAVPGGSDGPSSLDVALRVGLEIGRFPKNRV